MSFYPENIEVWLHAKKELYNKIRKLKTKKIVIPNKMIKEVSIKVFRKIMSTKYITKDESERYIPVMVKK